MKDIDISSSTMKILYYISIIGFILSIIFYGWILWILAVVIYFASGDRKKPKKKNVLNKSYQKFIFIAGILCIIFLAFFLTWV